MEPSNPMPKLYKSVVDLTGGRGKKKKKSSRKHYVRLQRVEEDEDQQQQQQQQQSLRKNRRSKRRTIQIGRKKFGLLRIKRPKMRLNLLLLLSPVRLLKKMRDAYVNMMLSLASRGGDWSGAVTGGAVYLPSAMPGIQQSSGIDSRKEDELLAYIDYLRRNGKLVPEPVLER